MINPDTTVKANVVYLAQFMFIFGQMTLKDWLKIQPTVYSSCNNIFCYQRKEL